MTLWAGKVTVIVELEDCSNSGGAITATRTERVRVTESGLVGDRVAVATATAGRYVIDRVNLGTGEP